MSARIHHVRARVDSVPVSFFATNLAVRPRRRRVAGRHMDRCQTAMSNQKTSSKTPSHRQTMMRRALLVALLASATIYLVVIPIGLIPGDSRLGIVEAIILLLVLLFGTGILERLERFAISDKGVEIQLKRLEVRQGELSKDIQALRFLFSNFLPRAERGHLWGLYLDKPFPFTKTPWFETELRNLRALEMIEAKPGVTVAGLPHEGDLKDFFSITESGTWFITQRQEFREQP